MFTVINKIFTISNSVSLYFLALQAPQPCIPASHNTGTPVSKTGLVHLSELCPVNETPQIPGVVIHCVNEIETRGLSQEGIYRICGTEKQVKGIDY